MSAIGHQGVFRLNGWSRQIHTEFQGFRATWEHDHTATRLHLRDYHPLRHRFPTDFGFTHGFLLRTHMTVWIKSSPTTPAMQRLSAITHHGFSLIRFRSPLLSESRLLSLPVGTEMFHFPTFPLPALYIQAGVTRYARALAGFPHSDILGSQSGYRLPEAYRRFPRPSSAPVAKASTMRP